MRISKEIRVKRGIVFGFVISLFLAGGCAQKEPKNSQFEALKKKQSSFRAFRNSYKFLFHKGSDIEFIVIANYTPNSSKKSEKFIIALSREDLPLNRSSFSLNGKKPVEFEKLSKDKLPKSIRRILPVWTNLYSLTFPKQSSKKVVLKINIDGEMKEAPFYKIPRYLVEKPSFKKKF